VSLVAMMGAAAWLGSSIGSMGRMKPAYAQTLTAPTLTGEARDKAARLNWTAVSGATRYKLRRNSDGSNNYTLVNGDIQGTEYFDTGLTNGKTYYYIVQAATSNSTGPASNQVSVTPSSSAPPAPTPSPCQTACLQQYQRCANNADPSQITACQNTYNSCMAGCS
jgi:hypothetical protein